MCRSIIVSGLILIAAGSVACDEKPTVSVYYESLCPDSIRFVTKQLFPSYTSPMRSYYNLKLVPYGKSQLIHGTDPSTWEFACHHGPRECYGNKVHGCALEMVRDTEMSLRFISCLMRKTLEDKTAPYPVEECASMTSVSSRDIVQCANGTRGNEVLKRNQEETDRLMNPLANVPTVVFNNRYDKKMQDTAVENFLSALCKHIQNPPHECQHVNGAGPVRLAAMSAATAVAARLML